MLHPSGRAALAPVVGLGEALLRLSSVDDRLQSVTELEVRVGGAELNCLAALAAFGHPSAWLTRLADNPLGQRIARHARTFDVDTHIDWDADARAPLYFVEHATPPRSSVVLYDRDDTAMRRLTSESFDWAAELSGAAVALTTGITCALSESATQGVHAFLDAACRREVATAFDVNFRSRLWSWPQARAALRPLLPLVDHLSASRHDLLELLPAERSLLDSESDTELAVRAIDAWSLTSVLMRSRRTPQPGVTEISTTIVTSDGSTTSEPVSAQIVDGFGAGDAALAAYLHGVLTGYDKDDLALLCSRAAAHHLTVPGDAWQGSLGEIETTTTNGIDR